MAEQKNVSDTSLQAFAGIVGAGLVLTLGLSALWAVSAPEPETTPVVANAATTEQPATAEHEVVVVSLYGDEGGAHQTPAKPASVGEPDTTTSLFDTR